MRKTMEEVIRRGLNGWGLAHGVEQNAIKDIAAALREAGYHKDEVEEHDVEAYYD